MPSIGWRLLESCNTGYGSQTGRRKPSSAASAISVIFFSVAPQVKHRSHSHSQIDEIHTHAHARTHAQTHTHVLPALVCQGRHARRRQMRQGEPVLHLHQGILTLCLYSLFPVAFSSAEPIKAGCVSARGGDEQTAFRRWQRKCKYTCLIQ